MKETKLFQLVTGIEMKPWLARNMLPDVNTWENGWSNSSANLRVVSWKLLEITQFAWPNLSIYFNFLCAVPRDDIIESTRFLMRPPVIIPPWYSPYPPPAYFRDQHSFRYTVLIHSLHVSKPSQLLYSPTPSLFIPALLCTSSLLTQSIRDTLTISPREETVPSSMAIRNVELIHECFPKQLCMGIARMN